MAGSEFDSADAPAPAPAPGNATPEAPAAPTASAAVQRFQSCRWRQEAEDGVPAHCTHRDVQPMTGTAGFDPEAWCPNCELYKVRRTPRKRPPQPPEDRYYY